MHVLCMAPPHARGGGIGWVGDAGPVAPAMQGRIIAALLPCMQLDDGALTA